MASVERYKTTKGVTKFLARVRVKDFKPTSKGGFDSEREAQAWGEALERELESQSTGDMANASVTTITLSELVKLYLQEENVIALRTFSEREQMLGEWVKEYGEKRVRDLSSIQMDAFKKKLKARGLTNSRVNRYLEALRSTWEWGIEGPAKCILPSHPWPRKLFLKEPGDRAVEATEDEVTALFRACDRVSSELGMLVRFLIGAGPRLSEALALTWRDVDLDHRDVVISSRKTGGAKRRVAMLAPAVEAVTRAKAVRHISDPRVFWQWEHRTAAWKQWDEARKDPEFPSHLLSIKTVDGQDAGEMTLHDCRHLCAGLLGRHGASEVELAAQLGHKSLAMVKRYTHLRQGHRGSAHEKADKAFGVG